MGVFLCAKNVAVFGTNKAIKEVKMKIIRNTFPKSLPDDNITIRQRGEEKQKYLNIFANIENSEAKNITRTVLKSVQRVPVDNY